MSKEGGNFSKSCFGCCLYRSLVNFNNSIVFWNILVIYCSWKGWRSVFLDAEHAKSGSQFAMRNCIIWSVQRSKIFKWVQFSSMAISIFKKNKNNWTRNYKWFSYHFFQLHVDHALICPKTCGKESKKPKILENHRFTKVSTLNIFYKKKF